MASTRYASTTSDSMSSAGTSSQSVPLALAGRAVRRRRLRSAEVYARFAPDALKQVADERAAVMRQVVEQR